MSGGGGSGTAGDSRIYYAPYVEGYHKDLLYQAQYYLNALMNSPSPYASLTIDDPDQSFFGAGNSLTTYPALYVMFEQYISGVDASALYETVLNSMINSATINAEISSEATYIDDEINQVSLPKINAGMRDMNAVMSTGFIHGKALLEVQKTKTVSKYSSTLKLNAMQQALPRWTEQLKWNTVIMESYMRLSQLYWSTKMDNIEIKAEMGQKDKTWRFTLLDFYRSYIGTLQGAVPSPQTLPGSSKTSRAISGALGGAAAGSAIGSSISGTTSTVTPVVNSAGETIGTSTTTGASTGGYWGAAIGAIIGIGAAFAENN